MGIGYRVSLPAPRYHTTLDIRVMQPVSVPGTARQIPWWFPDVIETVCVIPGTLDTLRNGTSWRVLVDIDGHGWWAARLGWVQRAWKLLSRWYVDGEHGMNNQHGMYEGWYESPFYSRCPTDNLMAHSSPDWEEIRYGGLAHNENT